jgi:tripartite-type tricarboxylate transporter receptor subunit TctC
MKPLIMAMVLTLLSVFATAALAAETAYPSKVIQIIVGLPAGSQPDTVARLLAHTLAGVWGRQVVIDNVTGAAGNIATERVTKAAPDGYTLGLLTQGQIAVNPSLYRLAFDTMRDLTPASQISASPSILVVSNALSVANARELIKLARTTPGELTFASGGSGSSPHIAAELLKAAAGLDIRHIPYKGVAAAVPDVLAGRVTMMFAPASLALPLVRDGKLRALAVTSANRFSAAQDLPTIAESGVASFQFTTWNGLLAPANTPQAIMRALHLEAAKALASANMRARFAELGLEPVGRSPDEFAALIKSESSRWAKLIKDAAITAE